MAYGQTMRMPPAVGAKTYAQNRNPFVATLLAVFLVGLGQLYNGDYKKMALIWVAVIVLLVFSAIVICPLIAFCIYVWAIFDAYRVASQKTALW